MKKISKIQVKKFVSNNNNNIIKGCKASVLTRRTSLEQDIQLDPEGAGSADVYLFFHREIVVLFHFYVYNRTLHWPHRNVCSYNQKQYGKLKLEERRNAEA